DAGDDVGAGEAANMAKYAAGEACVKAVDQAVHRAGPADRSAAGRRRRGSSG
ncbi:hypothetical protein HLB32_31885, partial [Streptomyces cacaoi]|nr:hypothetical protein [Streptomyces cacaoi]